MPYRKLVAAFVMTLMLVASVRVSGQEFQAMVRRVTAETSDGFRFTAWIRQQNVTLGQNVTIFYQVENRSNRTIHLVRKRGELETAITADGAFVIMVPVPFPDDHGDYNYSFTRVPRGGTHRGQLTVPGSRFNEARRWVIDVSFGLVRDVTGLDRQLRPGEDPAPLRGQLGERIEIVGTNGLVVEVEER